MNARDDLAVYIAGLNYSICNERCGQCTCAESDAEEAIELIDALLREHAHELAERIRAADFGDPYYVGTGQGQAADLIDPEVTK
ncbi:hypothetical protein ACWDX6_24080 [Streptomyces sp. NPDC003027]